VRRDDVAQVVAFPQPGTHRRRRVEGPREPDAQPPAGEEAVERPKYLASELLKRDWYPRHPLRRTLRWGAVGIGVSGAAAVLALGGASGGALLLVAVLLACATLGLVPLEPTARGVAIAGVGTVGTALAGWMRSDDPAAPLLVGCITVTASALFFRAAHRTARLARTLVGVGLGATALWLALTGGVDSLVVSSLEWQAWVLPSLRLTLGAMVVCSLLTFLDPTGHGGGWAIGGALLGWLTLEAVGAVALGLWPLHTAATSLGEPAALATVASPFLAALASVGLCQVWVLVSRPPTTGKREAPPSRSTIT
jgi:hypothetical protein